MCPALQMRNGRGVQSSLWDPHATYVLGRRFGERGFSEVDTAPVRWGYPEPWAKASGGRDHDGQAEAGRPARRPDTRGVDRPGGDDRDHRGPLERPAGQRSRVPGRRQRAGHRHDGDAPPRSEAVLPLLLPLGRGGLDTPGGGRRAGGTAARDVLARKWPNLDPYSPECVEG